MSKKDKYEVQKFTGIPVEADADGKYQLKLDQNGEAKLHTWRTGKHTKGKYKHPGQLMLTENNLTVVILAAEPMAFKDRHSETPLQRFLTVDVAADVLQQGLAKLGEGRR
ncbi:DUF7671 family protein [Limosilactobacillus caccae]|uniref:DUF7671 family protein n=1 Tax=Limosilactobacillus caccae TaxID=1926284 RepID=UPI00097090F5|nr:hypothetical protein [Limosilactobacillus caccae]